MTQIFPSRQDYNTKMIQPHTRLQQVLLYSRPLLKGLKDIGSKVSEKYFFASKTKTGRPPALAVTSYKKGVLANDDGQAGKRNLLE